MTNVKSPDVSRRRFKSNTRTGLILLSIALAFFVGVIVKYWVFGGA